MKIQQLHYSSLSWKNHSVTEKFKEKNWQSALIFGKSSLLTSTPPFGYLHERFPAPLPVFSSTPGEMIDNGVFDNSVVLTAIDFDKLVDASTTAVHHTYDPLKICPDLVTPVSCDGRKLIQKERTDEEIQDPNKVFESQTYTTGFFSHGEISPFNPGSRCGL